MYGGWEWKGKLFEDFVDPLMKWANNISPVNLFYSGLPRYLFFQSSLPKLNSGLLPEWWRSRGSSIISDDNADRAQSGNSKSSL